MSLRVSTELANLFDKSHLLGNQKELASLKEKAQQAKSALEVLLKTTQCIELANLSVLQPTFAALEANLKECSLQIAEIASRVSQAKTSVFAMLQSASKEVVLTTNCVAQVTYPVRSLRKLVPFQKSNWSRDLGLSPYGRMKWSWESYEFSDQHVKSTLEFLTTPDKTANDQTGQPHEQFYAFFQMFNVKPPELSSSYLQKGYSSDVYKLQSDRLTVNEETLKNSKAIVETIADNLMKNIFSQFLKIVEQDRKFHPKYGPQISSSQFLADHCVRVIHRINNRKFDPNKISILQKNLNELITQVESRLQAYNKAQHNLGEQNVKELGAPLPKLIKDYDVQAHKQRADLRQKLQDERSMIELNLRGKEREDALKALPLDPPALFEEAIYPVDQSIEKYIIDLGLFAHPTYKIFLLQVLLIELNCFKFNLSELVKEKTIQTEKCKKLARKDLATAFIEIEDVTTLLRHFPDNHLEQLAQFHAFNSQLKRPSEAMVLWRPESGVLEHVDMIRQLTITNPLMSNIFGEYLETLAKEEAAENYSKLDQTHAEALKMLSAFESLFDGFISKLNNKNPSVLSNLAVFSTELLSEVTNLEDMSSNLYQRSKQNSSTQQSLAKSAAALPSSETQSKDPNLFMKMKGDKETASTAKEAASTALELQSKSQFEAALKSSEVHAKSTESTSFAFDDHLARLKTDIHILVEQYLKLTQSTTASYQAFYTYVLMIELSSFQQEIEGLVQAAKLAVKK